MRISHQINQEEFDKLKQLDRIEFRQKIQEIEREDNSVLTNFQQSIWHSLIALVMLIVLDLWSRLHGNEWFGYTFFHKMMVIGLAYILLMFMADILGSIIKSRQISKVEKEYFKLEVKK